MNTASGFRTDPCFTAECPMCMESRTFYLLETVLGISGEHLVKGVACEKCAYEAVTEDASERERLLQASAIWQMKSEGKIRAEHVTDHLDALHSEVLERVRTEGRTWVCETCGEKNAMSFLECWKCHKERKIDP